MPIPNTADTGYFSAEAIEGLEQIGLDPYIAVERQKHHEAAVGSEPTAVAAEAGAKEEMRQKLGSATGKALYAARKRIVEPVFGQTKGARGIRGFLLRGLEKVGGRVATDLPDAQPAEDLASHLRRRGECRGIVRAEGGAEAERPEPRENPGAMAGCGRILGQTPSP